MPTDLKYESLKSQDLPSPVQGMFYLYYYYYSFSLLYNWVYAMVNYIFYHLIVAVSPLSGISKRQQNLTRIFFIPSLGEEE